MNGLFVTVISGLRLESLRVSDLALAFIADQAGEEIAGKVQLATEYYPSSVKYGHAHLLPEAPGYLKKEKV